MLAEHRIVIVDFGSQYTNLLARRIREFGVYCEVKPWNDGRFNFLSEEVKGIILSGSHASVNELDDLSLYREIATSRKPILGICFGAQLIAFQNSGEVTANSSAREFGKVTVTVKSKSVLFDGCPKAFNVWMSHADQIATTPINFNVTSISEFGSIASFESKERSLFGLQFHPEVDHTDFGTLILSNFVFRVSGCKANWKPEIMVDRIKRRIEVELGGNKAICGVSGGIDSTVVAKLALDSRPNRIHCVFIDTGLLRKNEDVLVPNILSQALSTEIIKIDKRDVFLKELRRVIDPELKRKIIGRLFIRTFEEVASKLGDATHLIQGTLFSDVIESRSISLKDREHKVIKSHHNVGGLPKDMRLKVIDPLDDLFKDEIRSISKLIGIPREIRKRHPFPGPGLAIRCIGEITERRLQSLKDAEAILNDVLVEHSLYDEVALAFPVLLPIRSVGVMGDNRTYDEVIAIRIVQSRDLMTADWYRIPWQVLDIVSRRIVNEVSGINRIVYDVTSKPPATIDWE